MSQILPSGITVAQVVQGLADIEALGLPLLGPEAALLAPLIVRLTEDAAAELAKPSAAEVLTGEIDAEQLAATAAEDAKFGPKP